MKSEASAIIAREPMGTLQILAIATCVLLNALDGFDILSISFASPGIAKDWGIDRAALGVVLSMELIGMGFGSILIGTLADRFGRRPAILGSLVVMVIGMFLASRAADVATLSLYRFCTGLGIGGMLACTNAMVAELANDRSRNLSVAIMASGYPIGAAAGGTIASMILQGGNWHMVFLFGATATAVMLPVAWMFLPESVSFLARRNAPDALVRINRILERMGKPAADSLPPAFVTASIPVVSLFRPDLALVTTLLAVAYFTHIITFYFILKWVPKIVADMGFTPAVAGGVLVWANVGGALGSLLLSFLTIRFNTRILVIVALLLASAMVIVFGRIPPQIPVISLVVGMVGFCTNGAVVGIYAIIADAFPTDLRAGGTGFVIGIGRGGAALGPIVAGLLFAAGAALPTVAFVMALGSLIAAAALTVLTVRQRIISKRFQTAG